MHILGLKVGLTVILATCLTGCSLYTVGPDLNRTPTPFGNLPVLHLISEDGETSADITHSDQGDRATLVYKTLNNKAYAADLSYYPFLPIVPETIAEQHDYWLVGINLTQTSDRSSYAILRFPHDEHLVPHSTNKTFEFMPVICPMTTLQGQDETAAHTSEGLPDGQKEKTSEHGAGLDRSGCDFETRAQLEAFVPEIIARAFEVERHNLTVKSVDDRDTTYTWQKLKIITP